MQIIKKSILTLAVLGIVFGVKAQEVKLVTGNATDFYYYNGNVGIGTTSPDKPLVIKTQSGNTEMRILVNDNTSRSAIYFGDIDHGSRGQIYYQHSDESFRFLTNAIERMRISTNGNVGIGTSSPENKFHVKASALGTTINDQSVLTTIEGSVVGNNSKFQILNKRNSNGSNWNNTSLRIQRVVDVTPQAFIDFGIEGKNSNYGLAFGTRNGYSGTQQVRMIIEENGNVGIGTIDTKGFKLGVKGKIAAEEVKVASHSNWPDFVFDKEYALPTLKEVESHIKEKGHLKDIPSAKEVAENGMFLGEMNAKLLQKIEELTLYTIAQEKEINTLKEQNAKIERLEKENMVLKSLFQRVSKLEDHINKENEK